MSVQAFAEINLDDSSIEWIRRDNRRFVDNLGHVFKADGFYYRAVYREKIDIVKDLVSKGLLQSLADEGLIPKQDIVEIAHARYGMLMKTRAARWSVKVQHYPLAAIKRAALTWLKINLRLLKQGYGLWDGHYGNFIYLGNGVPTWVDIGSFVPLENDQQLFGFKEFKQHFVLPLLVLSGFPALLKKRYQLIKAGGMTLKEARDLVGAEAWSDLQDKTGVSLGQLLSGTTGRRRTLHAMAELVRSLEIRAPKDRWSDYRTPEALQRALQPDRVYASNFKRDQTVLDLVLRSNPREILDVGANNGYHASLFAAKGYDVLGIDRDEFAVNSFYRWTRSHPELKLCASVDDFSATHQTADTVVSLALTHHLALSAKMPFDAICRRYAEMAERVLIVEFMPNGLGRLGEVIPSPLPDHYRLELFLSSLGACFANVEVIDYPQPAGRSPRILVHCTGPKT